MKNLGIVLTLANLRSLHDAPGKPTLFYRQRNKTQTHFKLVDTKRLFHDLLRRLAICKCVSHSCVEKVRLAPKLPDMKTTYCRCCRSALWVCIYCLKPPRDRTMGRHTNAKLQI